MDMITMVERFVCGARTRRHIIAIGDYVKEHTALLRVPFAQKSMDGFFAQKRAQRGAAIDINAWRVLQLCNRGERAA